MEKEEIEKSQYGSDEAFKFLKKEQTKRKPPKLTQNQIFILKKDKKNKK
jgi:hypothetical protein